MDASIQIIKTSQVDSPHICWTEECEFASKMWKANKDTMAGWLAGWKTSQCYKIVTIINISYISDQSSINVDDINTICRIMQPHFIFLNSPLVAIAETTILVPYHPCQVITAHLKIRYPSWNLTNPQMSCSDFNEGTSSAVPVMVAKVTHPIAAAPNRAPCVCFNISYLNIKLSYAAY